MPVPSTTSSRRCWHSRRERAGPTGRGSSACGWKRSRAGRSIGRGPAARERAANWPGRRVPLIPRINDPFPGQWTWPETSAEPLSYRSTDGTQVAARDRPIAGASSSTAARGPQPTAGTTRRNNAVRFAARGEPRIGHLTTIRACPNVPPFRGTGPLSLRDPLHAGSARKGSAPEIVDSQRPTMERSEIRKPTPTMACHLVGHE